MTTRETVDESWSKESIATDLARLGVTPGMELLVHSSLSSLGHVEGGAVTVIEALLDAVDVNKGTVLFPTLTGTREDGPEHPPRFDVRESACWTGLIPQTVRRLPGARRSLHPTHSVAALGANASNLTTGHEDCWTPCGYGSPYYRLARRGGFILLLGVTMESNTTLHTVEELAGSAYHMQPLPTRCTMIDHKGTLIERDMLLHDWGTHRCFRVLEEPLLAQGILRRGMVGRAPCLLIDSGRMVEYTVYALRSNPDLLVLR